MIENGLQTEATYPYTSSRGISGKCIADNTLGVVKCASPAFVRTGKTNAEIMAAID